MLSISEVRARTGLRASALRYYEETGLLRPAARVGGRRHYDPAVLHRLRLVACCRAMGLSIAEIRQLVADGPPDGPRWRALARRRIADLDRVIAEARATRRLLEETLDCDCVDVEECDRLGH